MFRRKPKAKAARRITLPPELILPIVSHTIARFIDDVITGPSLRSRRPMEELASDPPDGGPIPALLLVSYQVRQATLEVLSRALDVPLVKAGTWRLAQKPFAVIAPLRAMWAKPFDEKGDYGRRDVVENLGACTGMSAALQVYWALRAIATLDYDWLHPGRFSAGDRGYAFDSPGPHVQTIAAIEDTMAQACVACPLEFEDVLLPQVEQCRAEHRILTLLYIPFRAVREMWLGWHAVTRLRGPNAHTGVLLSASEMLRRIQLSGQELLDDWPYETVTLHTEVTVFRLHDWAELLDSIHEETGDLQELLELQAIASELQITALVPKRGARSRSMLSRGQALESSCSPLRPSARRGPSASRPHTLFFFSLS
ncbi:hypothetical protein PsYK624_118460 [Phanerochaete sordida]|uniref:Uncharacterized protein n=1 Tax=Phanerochaete sordida TaxID=48140 RepID=A0A9P3GIE6_9APHY|nr:hypothetical protein PsYK624_118460 [Phanerochaete sordida]